MGETLAFFHSDGNLLNLSERLKIVLSGFAIVAAVCLSKQLLIPSGPLDFEISRLFSILRTSSLVVSIESNRWSVLSCSGGRLGFISGSLAFSVKVLLNMLHLSTGDV